MKFCVKVNDESNLNWIALIVTVLCDIINKTEDVQIILKGTSFVRLYIPLCKNIIEKRNQTNIIGSMIDKLLSNTNIMESTLLFTGNLVSQYFYNISKKLETNILEIIVRRTYRVRFFYIVQNAKCSTINGTCIFKINFTIS